MDSQQLLCDPRAASGTRALFFDGLGAIAVDLEENEAAALCQRHEVVELIEDAQSRSLKSTPRDTSAVESTLIASNVAAGTSCESATHEAANRPRASRVPWNIDMVDAPRVWDWATGAGIRVALLDTGIADDQPDVPVAGGVCFVPGGTSWVDDDGHGTHCAGIVGARNFESGFVGVAPDCSLYAVKVLASHGRGNLSSILAGLLWSADHRMHVVAVNIGSQTGESSTGFIVYERAAAQCMNTGALVLAPAGNAGNTPSPWLRQPARCRNVVAVGAVNRRGELARFSCRGPASLPSDCDVEILAPGAGICSGLPDGRRRNMSGTSMACAHVAGAVALLRQRHSSWAAAAVRARLRSSARMDPDRVHEWSVGVLNCHAAAAR